jgi:type IV pilus assembly protein PilW
MNEDAQLALSIMARDIQLAGYAETVSSNAVLNVFVKTFNGRPVFGCDTGFVGPTASAAALACNAAGNSPSFEVAYEADISNTSPTAANVPTDCLGTGLVQQVAGAINYYVAHNRYYVATGGAGLPELRCASDVAAGGQALVENVESMVVWFGEANAANKRQIVRYVTAAGVSDFNNVVAVRVCLVMRSAEAVLPVGESLSYVGCDGTVHSVTDRLLRRAYSTTATLRSKMYL